MYISDVFYKTDQNIFVCKSTIYCLQQNMSQNVHNIALYKYLIKVPDLFFKLHECT